VNDERKRVAEDFARLVMTDSVMRHGLECVLEGLEWAIYERWRAQPSGEMWRQLAGELAAVRAMGARLAALGMTGEGDGAGR
jgi:hypothetical protein